jgi:hypothetical protein
VRWGDEARICERVDNRWDTYRRIAKNGKGFFAHLEMSNGGGADGL